MESTWGIREQMDRATLALVRGLERTAAIGVIEAKTLVNKDTTALQGSIMFHRAKKADDGTIECEYGPSRASNPNSGESITTYAVYQEFDLGEQMPDGSTRDRKGGKPYMRPSMRKAESVLLENIAKAYKELK